jgi:hypothetical protein
MQRISRVRPGDIATPATRHRSVSPCLYYNHGQGAVLPNLRSRSRVALEGRNTARVLGGISVCEAQRERYTFGINSTTARHFYFPIEGRE